jgi:hypothetical protein
VTRSDPSRFAFSCPTWPFDRLAMNSRPLSITKGMLTLVLTWPKMFLMTGFNKNWPILF